MVTADRPLLTGETLSQLAIRMWIDTSPEGLVAMALLTPGAGMAAGHMQALADLAGLADGGQPMPDCRIQLTLQEPDVVLAVRDTDLAVRVPASPQWAGFVQQGGTVVVLAGALPIARDAGRVAVDQYLLDGLLPRQVWLGKTRLSGSWTAAQLAGEACLRCGSAKQPLHTGETIAVLVAEDVVRDTPTVRCTGCMVLPR